MKCYNHIKTILATLPVTNKSNVRSKHICDNKTTTTRLAKETSIKTVNM